LPSLSVHARVRLTEGLAHVGLSTCGGTNTLVRIDGERARAREPVRKLPGGTSGANFAGFLVPDRIEALEQLGKAERKIVRLFSEQKERAAGLQDAADSREQI